MSQDRILSLVMQDNEITWQTILLDLVKSGEIDPWDVNISLLSQKYLSIIRQLQESNLFISGKVLLASAILLKIKSDKLLTEDIGSLDELMFPPDIGSLDEFMTSGGRQRIILDVEPVLTIKTPQARKKKVQIDDLMDALERALEVNERRLFRIAEKDRIPENLFIPEKKIDITKIIESLHEKIVLFFTKKPKLTFSELVGSDKKEDKIITFIPLLHLSNHERVDLNQEQHFGEINITLIKKEN